MMWRWNTSKKYCNIAMIFAPCKGSPVFIFLQRKEKGKVRAYTLSGLGTHATAPYLSIFFMIDACFLFRKIWSEFPSLSDRSNMGRLFYYIIIHCSWLTVPSPELFFDQDSLLLVECSVFPVILWWSMFPLIFPSLVLYTVQYFPRYQFPQKELGN